MKSNLAFDRELIQCALDLSYFVENYCWIKTRFSEKQGLIRKNLVKFKLYPFQKNILKALSKNQDTHLVKSRQMGMTWLMSAYLLWRMIFSHKDEGFKSLIISQKEDKARVVLDHIKFMYYKLPPAFQLKDLRDNRHSLESLLNNVKIQIESANDNAGRGLTLDCIFIDEAAFIPRSEEMYTSLKSATDCLILGSTPNGKGNLFHRIYELGDRSGFQFIKCYWNEHPHYDSKWYKKEIASMTDSQIQQELECSFEGSVHGRIYPEFSHEYHIKDLKYNKYLPIFCAIDYGLNDPTAILWFQVLNNNEIYIIDEYQNRNKDIDHYGQYIRKWIIDHKAKGNVFGIYGDPQGAARSLMTGHSLHKRLAERHNLKVTSIRSKVIDGINSVKILLKNSTNPYEEFEGEEQPKLFISKDCKQTIDAFYNYRWKEEGDSPKHDRFCHLMDAVRYFTIQRFPIQEKTQWIFS